MPTLDRGEPDRDIANGTAQRMLDQARRRWRRARIHNYRFELAIICFCFPRGTKGRGGPDKPEPR